MYSQQSSGYSIDALCTGCNYQSSSHNPVPVHSVSSSTYNKSMQTIDYMVAAPSQSYNAVSLINRGSASYAAGKLSGPIYSAPSSGDGDPYAKFKLPAMTTNVFDPESFLSIYRIPTMFIGKAKDVQDLVEECFEKTLGKKLPDNIIIRICDKKELKSIHNKLGGMWSDGIVGFAVNRNEKNRINEIFVKEDSLDKVMITIGHELGHLMGKRLGGRKEEEKAFAFELAWLDTIREHDIGGIGKNIIQINPAKNNFHDLAFDFVINLVRNGMRAIDVFRDLVYSYA